MPREGVAHQALSREPARVVRVVFQYHASYQNSNIHVLRTHLAIVEFRSLSKTEAKVVLSLEADRQDLVTLAGIQKRADVSSVFARKLAHDLVRRGWLQRVRRGTYLLNPSRHGPEALPDTDPLRIGSRLLDPYYFGYATAAELHGLFPQASRVYYLVTTKRYGVAGHSSARFRVVRTKRHGPSGLKPWFGGAKPWW